MKRRSKATKAPARRSSKGKAKAVSKKPKRAVRSKARGSKPAPRGRKAALPAAATRRNSGAAKSARPRTAPKPGAAADPAREIRRLQTARRNLERQLTAAVQEIGILRQWEVRARLLESEIEKREAKVRELEERLGGADLVRQPRLL